MLLDLYLGLAVGRPNGDICHGRVCTHSALIPPPVTCASQPTIGAWMHGNPECTHLKMNF